MTGRVDALAAAGVPFVHAVVVRAQPPTSARPGDDAVILSDGSIEGFVGGQCAAESVRTAALEVLDAGEPLLLRVLPAGDAGLPQMPGARVVVNPCFSGGALEIFLEPVASARRVHVVGSTPVSEAVSALAEHLGFAVGRERDGDPMDGAVAVVVSSLGEDEQQAIRTALDAGVGFVGLVASRRRGDALVAAMGLSPDERQRVHVRVGVEIGAVEAEEIALSIMAAIVRGIRREGLTAPEALTDRLPGMPEDPARAVDRVCGMTVVVMEATPHLEVDGEHYWFCGSGCRDSFVERVAR